jgi:hypothetical protein
MKEPKQLACRLRLNTRANVILNIERSLAIVQPLLALELDDELTPLPVYRP